MINKKLIMAMTSITISIILPIITFEYFEYSITFYIGIAVGIFLTYGTHYGSHAINEIKFTVDLKNNESDKQNIK